MMGEPNWKVKGKNFLKLHKMSFQIYASAILFKLD